MNILLLNCPVVWAGIKRPIFPLGLAYIGTFLENHGHSVKLIDLNIYPDHIQKLKDVLRENRFEYIGVSLRNSFFRTLHQIYQWKNIIGMVKSLSPRSKILVGGPAFSLLNWKVMNYIEEIDIGVIGRGEEAFLELTNKPPLEVRGIIYRDEKGLHSTPFREEINPDDLPIPKRDWSGLDLSQYDMLNLQTRRGCSFKCNYCKYRYLEGDVIRLRSISRVRKEVEYLSSLGIRKIFFVDSAFNYPLDYSLEIIDILAKYDLEWGAFFRAGLLNKDYAKKLLEGRCKIIIISAESGSQDIHDYLQSGSSVNDILDAVEISRSFVNKKISVIFTFIIGLPKEKFKDIVKTLILIVRILLNRCFVHVNVFFEPFKCEISKKGDKINMSLGSNNFYKRCIYLGYPVLVILDFITNARLNFMRIFKQPRKHANIE